MIIAQWVRLEVISLKPGSSIRICKTPIMSTTTQSFNYVCDSDLTICVHVHNVIIKLQIGYDNNF